MTRQMLEWKHNLNYFPRFMLQWRCTANAECKEQYFAFNTVIISFIMGEKRTI